MKKSTGTVLKIATLVLGVAGMVISNIKEDKDREGLKEELKKELLDEISKEN